MGNCNGSRQQWVAGKPRPHRLLHFCQSNGNTSWLILPKDVLVLLWTPLLFTVRWEFTQACLCNPAVLQHTGGKNTTQNRRTMRSSQLELSCYQDFCFHWLSSPCRWNCASCSDQSVIPWEAEGGAAPTSAHICQLKAGAAIWFLEWS